MKKKEIIQELMEVISGEDLDDKNTTGYDIQFGLGNVLEYRAEILFNVINKIIDKKLNEKKK